jgi:TolB protein
VLLAVPAYATFPGANGKIVFESGDGHDFEIFTVNPDGTGLTQLTDNDANDGAPRWSPDGTKILFSSDRDCCGHLYLMDEDGSNQTELTTASERDDDPAWSPDGTRIAFIRYVSCASFCYPQLFVADADGTGATQLPTARAVQDPVWSPDGSEIAMVVELSWGPSGSGPGEIYTIRPDGSGLTNLSNTGASRDDTNPDWSPDGSKLVLWSDYRIAAMNRDGTGFVAQPAQSELEPGWSPDGRKIAFVSYQDPPSGVYTMNSDFTNRTRLTNRGGINLDWQPLPLTYIRPKAAAPTRVSLVPAYDQCRPASANRTHGPPLGFPSCAPPSQTSGQLTLGTPDSNGQQAKSVSFVRYGVQVGNPATPADEANVRIIASITDVRKKSDLSDYTGELSLDQGLRITDRDNTPNPGGPGPGTVTDAGFPVTIPCATTADVSVGSTCAIDTTVDALVPNTVKEGRRAVWAIGQVKVYDGGPDGLASTTGDNTLFMDEGLFVP